MDITLAGLVGLTSVLINQLWNWGKAKLAQGKEEERREVMKQELEDLKKESKELEGKMVEQLKALKSEIGGEIQDVHERITRTQKDQSESNKEISRGISELLQRSAKIEGSISTMEKMTEIMMANRK